MAKQPNLTEQLTALGCIVGATIIVDKGYEMDDAFKTLTVVKVTESSVLVKNGTGNTRREGHRNAIRYFTELGIWKIAPAKVSVEYIRSNEIHDIYLISKSGIKEYYEYVLRGTLTEKEVRELYNQNEVQEVTADDLRAELLWGHKDAIEYWLAINSDFCKPY